MTGYDIALALLFAFILAFALAIAWDIKHWWQSRPKANRYLTPRQRRTGYVPRPRSDRIVRTGDWE